MSYQYNGITCIKAKNKAFIAIPLRTSLKVAAYNISFRDNGFNEANCLPIFNEYYEFAKKLQRDNFLPVFVFDKRYEKDEKSRYYAIDKAKLDKELKENHMGFLKSSSNKVYAHITANNCKRLNESNGVEKSLLNALFGGRKNGNTACR